MKRTDRVFAGIVEVYVLNRDSNYGMYTTSNNKPKLFVAIIRHISPNVTERTTLTLFGELALYVENKLSEAWTLGYNSIKLEITANIMELTDGKEVLQGYGILEDNIYITTRNGALTYLDARQAYVPPSVQRDKKKTFVRAHWRNT